MTIHWKRVLFGAGLAAIFSIGKGALAADAQAERTQMCGFCATTEENGLKICYDYVDHAKAPHPETGVCTYPPCPSERIKDNENTKKKLYCLACRALCPETPGTPKDPKSPAMRQDKEGKAAPASGAEGSQPAAAPKK